MSLRRLIGLGGRLRPAPSDAAEKRAAPVRPFRDANAITRLRGAGRQQRQED